MEQYSWNQLSETKIVKTIDYSVFKGRSTGIPQSFYDDMTQYLAMHRDVFYEKQT